MKGRNYQMKKTTTNKVMWTIQGVLAAMFLFAGAMKLLAPIADLTQQMPLPGALVRFIGVAEVMGALGLVLPGLLKIQQYLTTLAAAGLVLIMAGATVLTVAIGGGAGALMPFTVGVLAG